MHSRSIEGVSADSELSVIIFGYQAERSTKHIGIRGIYAHRIVAFHPTVAVRRLVPMVAAVPKEYSPSVEVVRDLFRSGGPEPVVLCSLFLVFDFAEVKV